MITMIGIDPSLTATGYAHTDGSLSTIPLAGALNDRRLYELYEWLTRILKTERPQLAVIEELPPSTRGHGAGLIGMSQGITRLTLIQGGMPYRAIAPATLKVLATGKGNATKDDMRMEWYKRTGNDVRDNNQVDAAWLRELGLQLLGEPTFPLPPNTFACPRESAAMVNLLQRVQDLEDENANLRAQLSIVSEYLTSATYLTVPAHRHTRSSGLKIRGVATAAQRRRHHLSSDRWYRRQARMIIQARRQ